MGPASSYELDCSSWRYMSRLFAACDFAAGCAAGVGAGGAYFSEHAATSAARPMTTEHAILRAGMKRLPVRGTRQIVPPRAPVLQRAQPMQHRARASVIAAGIASEIAIVGRDALVALVTGASDRTGRGDPPAHLAARQRLGSHCERRGRTAAAMLARPGLCGDPARARCVTVEELAIRGVTFVRNRFLPRARGCVRCRG